MEIMYYWPLLGGESSGTGARYEKAAALVDLAEDGIGLPEQIILDPQSNFQNARKFYFLFVRLGFIWFLNYFALIILNFLEKPLWCTNYSGTYSCDNRDYFYLGELPYLTGVESLVYEGITLIILVAHTFFPISYEGRQLYWKDPLNRLKVVCLIILEADILVYAIYLSPMTFDYLPFRLGPYIRVMLFMLNFSCQLLGAGCGHRTFLWWLVVGHEAGCLYYLDLKHSPTRALTSSSSSTFE
ncbi:hypothetical protein I3843_04G115800 [Carya illinoinensis]|nr:hypothetical protein I3843_04G115800 [Carya illinoinensis]